MPAPDKKSPTVQIPWNEDLETLLLHCVITKGAHVTKRTEDWHAVATMFFKQPEFIVTCVPIGDDESDAIRRLKERLKKVCTRVTRDIERGNQSGKDGELSPLYKHVKQISEEIEAHKEAKVAKRKLTETLNEVERDTLARSGPLKMRQLNGEVIDITKNGSRKTKASLDERVLAFLEGNNSSGEDKKYDAQEALLLRFTQWLNDKDYGVYELLEACKLSPEHHEEVADIGVEHLVFIYCTRESAVHFTAFKTELQSFGLSPLVCSKMCMGLQKWRREVDILMKLEAEPTQFTTPSPTAAAVDRVNDDNNVVTVVATSRGNQNPSSS